MDPRLISQLGEVRLAAIRQACEAPLVQTDEGWTPGHGTCDRRLPFNAHTISTLVRFGLLDLDDDGTARATRKAHEVLESIDGGWLEAAE
jgi:hypothetical protein